MFRHGYIWKNISHPAEGIQAPNTSSTDPFLELQERCNRYKGIEVCAKSKHFLILQTMRFYTGRVGFWHKYRLMNLGIMERRVDCLYE